MRVSVSENFNVKSGFKQFLSNPLNFLSSLTELSKKLFKVVISKLEQLIRILSSKRGLKILGGIVGVGVLIKILPQIKNAALILYSNMVGTNFLKTALGMLVTAISAGRRLVESFIGTLKGVIEFVKNAAEKGVQWVFQKIGLNIKTEAQVIKEMGGFKDA
jgi:uncharacterized NAD-dependent epimerase/dehydratase family protein